MSLEKAIRYKKENRKQYKGSKDYDRSCRNHGSCEYCRMNREYKNLRKMQESIDKIANDVL